MSEGQKEHQVIGICPNCHTPVLESEPHAYFLGGGDPKANPPIKPRTLVRHTERKDCGLQGRYVVFSGGEDV